MGKVGLQVDVSSLQRVRKAIGELRTDLRGHVLAKAVNLSAGYGLKFIRQMLPQWGGWQAGYVQKHTRRSYANAANLTSKIIGRSRYSNIVEFGASQGAAGVNAAPWSRGQLFKHAFIRTGRSGNRLVFVRKGSSRLPIKSLYGPGIGREIERDDHGHATLIRESIDHQMQRNMIRVYDSKLGQIKAKYNL